MGHITRHSLFAMISAFAVCLSGCDLIYGLLDKEGAEEQQIIGKILPYEQNEKVLEAQMILKLYGYAIGTPDGVLGGRTREILGRFQVDAGLKKTRFIDQATWDELHVFEDAGLIRDAQLNFKKVQQCLKDAGLDPGAADGVWGEKTRLAVQKFQADHDLPADGRIGYKTLSVLMECAQGVSE